MIDRIWGGGNRIGALYYMRKHDLHRVGNSFMKGRLHEGDIVMCIAHTGDCFYDYILIEYGQNFIKGILNSRFGAYAMEDTLMEVSEKEYHQIMTGDFVSGDKNWSQFIKSLKATRQVATGEAGGGK